MILASYNKLRESDETVETRSKNTNATGTKQIDSDCSQSVSIPSPNPNLSIYHRFIFPKFPDAV